MDYPLVKPRYYRSLLKDIIDFIAHPHNEPDLVKSARLKVYDTIGVYILKMMCLIPVLLFFAMVYDPVNVQSANMAERFSPLVFLLVGGLILPLVEEIAFRLSLIYKPIYLSLTFTALTYYFLTKAIYHTKISAVDETFVTRVSIAVVIGIILFAIQHLKSVEEVLASFWQRHFRSIFYISSLVFAWMHISKYELVVLNIVLLPILTLPQLMSAIIYGYTRVKFGFQYPLVLHMVMNLIVIGLSLLPFAD